MKKLLFLIIFTFISFTQVKAQHFLSTSGTAIVNELGDTIILRGMGLGGWMVQEGYMLQTSDFAGPQHEIKQIITEVIGEANTEIFYDAWLANHCRKIDIDSLKAWGFNSVRLPMHYNLYTLPIEEEPISGQNTWLEKGFILTDSLISWCAANEMYVVLDLHAAPGGQGYAQEISDYDPTKPSLWESSENKTKAAALWKRLAERYVGNQWIAGYDLLNEPNWDLPGGTALRAFYEQVTDSIRSVDQDHILFIEGNWFANDFTGLTPPWDDQFVYSPHKYWSYNTENDLDWITPLRDAHNVPIYFGESGENSNVWFKDAINLMESNGMGWAWWPMKKVESIAGPLSVTKTSGYQALLNYWDGNGSAPSQQEATNTLMQLTENLKIENCFYQKDVPDAMIRQVATDETKPYSPNNIPGVIYAAEYDLGRVGEAYLDNDLATYHVNTGIFTAWNNGWQFRNDGVDIEECEDNINTNGFNVGWINEGEWMQYTIDVQESGVYEIQMRLATPGSTGRFHYTIDGSDLTTLRYVPNSGGYQDWQTLTVPNVVLTPDNKTLRFYSDGSDYNFSSFEFVKVGELSSIETDFLTGITQDLNTIQMNINKPLELEDIESIADFQVVVNNQIVPINQVSIDAENTRIVSIDIDVDLISTDVIKVSYFGNQLTGTDGLPLNTFNIKEVLNNLRTIHILPTLMEAETFFRQAGVGLENTNDTNGGKNVGDLDQGDYMDYIIKVPFTTEYLMEFRTASESETGAFVVQFVTDEGFATDLKTVEFNSTGSWQSWETTSESLVLPAGTHQLRLRVDQGNFKFNWLNFSYLTAIPSVEFIENFNLYPNPTNGSLNINSTLKNQQEVQLAVYNVLGQKMWTKQLDKTNFINERLDINDFPSGQYLVVLQLENGLIHSERILKK